MVTCLQRTVLPVRENNLKACTMIVLSQVGLFLAYPLDVQGSHAPGKSWIFWVQFPGPGKSWKFECKVLESPGIF